MWLLKAQIHIDNYVRKSHVREEGVHVPLTPSYRMHYFLPNYNSIDLWKKRRERP